MSSMMFGSPTAGFVIVANTRGFRKCPWRVEAVDKFTGKTVRGPAEDVTASLETGPSAGRTILPSLIRRILSPMIKASDTSWVTKSTVFFSVRWMSRKDRCSRSRFSGSTEPKGSSISRIGGSAANARATPTRCASPPESSCGYLSRYFCGRPVSSIRKAVRLMISGFFHLSSSGTTAMLRRTV